MAQYDMITVLGPTASGKTRLAVALADRLDGEILSADSRQVYRGMDIGTGKDLGDYILDGRAIPYHLIDIADAGTKYNVYEFQGDFKKAYTDIVARKKFPVMCGGTGLYLESVLKGYRLIPVPENPELRRKLEGKSLKELTRILEGYKTLHNTTDVRNMIASDAIAELTRYGYKAAITGRGKVTKQVIDNNRKFVHLYLEPPGH